jgi:hypothetical protein
MQRAEEPLILIEDVGNVRSGVSATLAGITKMQPARGGRLKVILGPRANNISI